MKLRVTPWSQPNGPTPDYRKQSNNRAMFTLPREMTEHLTEVSSKMRKEPCWRRDKPGLVYLLESPLASDHLRMSAE